MNSGRAPKKRRPPGHGSLDDLLYLHKAGAPSSGDHIESLAQETLDSKTFAKLLNQNFSKLDAAGRGITEESLSKLIMKPDSFNQDEYVMLLLLAKYFSTIANLCGPTSGPPVITQVNKDVLCQFLIHGNLSLAELHRWCVLSAEPGEMDNAPPPISS